MKFKISLIIFCIFFLFRVESQLINKAITKNYSCNQVINKIKEIYYNYYGVYDTISRVIFVKSNKDINSDIIFGIILNHSILKVDNNFNEVLTSKNGIKPNGDTISMKDFLFYDNFFNHKLLLLEDTTLGYVFNNPYIYKDSLILYLKDLNFDWNYKYDILYLLQRLCYKDLLNLIKICFESVKEYDKLKLNTSWYNDSINISHYVLQNLLEQFKISIELKRYVLINSNKDTYSILLEEILSYFYKQKGINGYMTKYLMYKLFSHKNLEDYSYYRLANDSKRKFYKSICDDKK